MRISVFDIFKVGIGPSSSHTMGPWKAALDFTARLDAEGRLGEVTALAVELEGSLAKTGRGHGTPLAIQMGLCGASIEEVAPASVAATLEGIRESRRLLLSGRHEIPFYPERDIRFCDRMPEFHPNGLVFDAALRGGRSVRQRYFSLGGGFVVREGEAEAAREPRRFPYPIDTAVDLERWCVQESLPVEAVVRANEESLRSRGDVDAGLDALWRVMRACVHEGCHRDGVLPGGLAVRRRAPSLNARLLPEGSCDDPEAWLERIRCGPKDAQTVMDWVSAFALAVNEVNAAFGRVVTAPTNGAAGVIPAVLLYHLCFDAGVRADAVRRFLLVAGEIGSLFKKGATISAALGGCQAEIGVSSAMAAAGLAACCGAGTAQVLIAAEIAMEHHLGLTCDPIAGLVQIPCIERNVMGATKAIAAARMALHRDPADVRVSLDAVIRTMRETALDMNSRYKETAEGGLAIAVPVALSEC